MMIGCTMHQPRRYHLTVVARAATTEDEDEDDDLISTKIPSLPDGPMSLLTAATGNGGHGTGPVPS